MEWDEARLSINLCGGGFQHLLLGHIAKQSCDYNRQKLQKKIRIMGDG
jgi:hypothetical protein